MGVDQGAAGWVQAARVTRYTGSAKAPGTLVLDECSLSLAPGQLTAIVGPSGAGKSSLMYCLSGLDAPNRGNVWVGGEDIYALSPQKRAVALRERVGFVFQQYNLVPFLTVEENTTLPVALAGRRVDRSHADSLLDYLGLREKRRVLASSLSGGEQQRVALCRAMLLRPAVIFADEPTGALDSGNTSLVLDVLRDLATRGTNVVVVTHDVDAATRADRIVFMRDGRITGVSDALTAAEILAGMRVGWPVATEGERE